MMILTVSWWDMPDVTQLCHISWAGQPIKSKDVTIQALLWKLILLIHISHATSCMSFLSPLGHFYMHNVGKVQCIEKTTLIHSEKQNARIMMQDQWLIFIFSAERKSHSSNQSLIQLTPQCDGLPIPSHFSRVFVQHTRVHTTRLPAEVLNLEIQNACLLGKWLFKLMNEEGTW